MGKIKKIKASQTARKVPLDQQIEDDRIAKQRNRNKVRIRKDEDDKVSSSFFNNVI